mmetsp:Transcript_11288/g.23785  ORF Transcript_11288/g.23785 Transcript_11288/m.23785 type:complete len:85 (-) Transcript_11288:96-350(-)
MLSLSLRRSWTTMNTTKTRRKKQSKQCGSNVRASSILFSGFVSAQSQALNIDQNCFTSSDIAETLSFTMLSHTQLPYLMPTGKT